MQSDLITDQKAVYKTYKTMNMDYVARLPKSIRGNEKQTEAVELTINTMLEHFSSANSQKVHNDLHRT